MSKPFQHIILLYFFLLSSVAFAQENTDEKLAAQYYQNGEFDKAVVLYEKLFNKKPDPFYYSYYLDCLLELKDFKNAEKVTKKLIKINSSSLKYIVDLGYVYTRADETAKANKQFELAIKELKNDPQQVIDLSNAFLLRGQTDYAIESYEKGRKLFKNSYPFNFELAVIYEKKQDYSSMMNEYVNLIEYNAAYLGEVKNKLQSTLSEDPENKKNETLKTLLLKRVQKDPSNVFFSELFIWLAIQQKDFETAFVQAKSLDRRFKEDGERIYKIAQLSASNKDYDVAIKAYQYVITKGPYNFYYLNSKIELLETKYLKIVNTINYTQEELVTLEDDYYTTIVEFGKNAGTILLMKDLAHLKAFHLDKEQEAIELLNTTLSFKDAVPKLQAVCKIELANILLMTGDVWEATLLYSQVEKAFKSEPVGHEAKFKNAKLSYYIGEFQWAKAQLDVLKGATSKLIANDAMDLSLLISDNIDYDSSTVGLRLYSKADLLLFQNKDDLALLTLDSINRTALSHPLFDEVLFKKAEIMIKNRKYESADTLLQKLIDYHSYDILADDALFKLAELKEYQFKDKEKAMELYQKLITEYPGSLFAVEARKRFRNLRGDQIN